MPVPNQFANVTTSIPLSQLDANFNTPITLGNTAIQLGNTVTTLNNMTLANVTVTSGNVTITNVTVTTANVTTANIATAQIANVTVSGTGTFAAGSNTAPSITTSGDTNTGIFFPAADTIAFTEGGVEAARFDSSGNLILNDTARIGSSRFSMLINPSIENAIAVKTSSNGDIAAFRALSSDNNEQGAININTQSQYMAFRTANVERMRIDSAGNLGLGVTPSAWSSVVKAYQVSNSALVGTSTQTILSQNYFFDGTDKYISNSNASLYIQTIGQHRWYTAPSGTAGNAITFTQAMTLDASGRLGIGTSSPVCSLDVFTTGSEQARFVRDLSTDAGTSIGSDNDGAILATLGIHNLRFFTNNTERVRITSDGAFCINNTAGTSGSSLAIKGSGATSATYNIYTTNSTPAIIFATENNGRFYTGTLGESPYNNTTASAANMFVTSGGVLQRSTSSGRFKTEVEDLEVGRADAILNLRPVWYRSTCQSDNPNWSWYGLIAEDVAQVEPRLVHWGYDSDDLETVEVEIEVEKERTVKDDDGNETVEAYTETVLKPIQQPKEGAQLRPDGVQYDRMTVLLLDIVKRQQSRLEALEAEVQALRGNA